MLYRHAFVSLFVLFQIAHLTSHAFQCTVGLIFIDYKEGSYVFACATRSRFSFCELLPWYFRLCTYCLCMMYLTTSEVERACVFPPPRLCLSTYGFLYVPAATALSKGHKPLPEMGHFLLADRLCTASLKGVCKRGSTVHKHEILISKTYVTSFKVP